MGDGADDGADDGSMDDVSADDGVVKLPGAPSVDDVSADDAGDDGADDFQRSMASQGDALNFSLRQETEERWGIRSSVEDGTSEGLDEPKLGVIGSDTLEFTDTGLSSLSLGDSVARSLDADGEIHTENTCGGIVLNSEIDMFVDTKSEVTGVGEVSLP